MRAFNLVGEQTWAVSAEHRDRAQHLLRELMELFSEGEAARCSGDADRQAGRALRIEADNAAHSRRDDAFQLFMRSAAALVPAGDESAYPFRSRAREILQRRAALASWQRRREKFGPSGRRGA